MKYIFLIISLLISFLFSLSAFAQWISQNIEDPFGENHIVGAATVKFGKGLIVRCVGGKNLQLMFLPNEMGSDEVITMANLAGTIIKLRIDKDAIDQLPATVQNSDGKVLAIADIDATIAKRMAQSKKRIAVVLEILENQFGSTSFSVRGSGRNIKKVLAACPNMKEQETFSSNGPFQAINKLKKSFYTDPKDGNRIIQRVKDFLIQIPYRDKVIKMTVDSVRRPYKVSVEFTLNDRLAQTELKELSRTVREGAGEGFDRYFVGFRLAAGGSGYWATAHHDPNLEVKLLGLSAEAYDTLVDNVKNYKPAKDEEIIADGIMSHGFTYHLVILKTVKGVIVRRYHHNGEEWSTGSGAPLKKKGGRYWEVENSFGENYRLYNGMLELHDKDGLITKCKISKR